MIRYEIETNKAGIILDAALVSRVVTTKATRKPTVIVMVEPSNQKAFEKYIEGQSTCISYFGDPRQPGTTTKDWRRK